MQPVFLIIIFLGHLLMLNLQVNKLLCEYVDCQNKIQVKMILTLFDSQFPLSSNNPGLRDKEFYFSLKEIHNYRYL